MARASLSALLESASGRAGNIELQNTTRGAVIRSRCIPHNPRTSAQTAIRDLMARAADLWQGLSSDEVAAWRAYAADAKGTGFNAFCGLTIKVLQIDPQAAVPSLPPTAILLPDPLALSAAGGTGAVEFTLLQGQNSPEILTELLLQKLPTRHRMPLPRSYKTALFHHFTPASPTASIPAEPGFYTPAYRFVNKTTGQQTALIALHTLQVL